MHISFLSGERWQGLLCTNVYSQPGGFSLSSCRSDLKKKKDVQTQTYPSYGTGTKTAGNLLAKQREVAVIFLLAVDAACDPIDCCETCLFSMHLFLFNIWANVQLTTSYNC